MLDGNCRTIRLALLGQQGVGKTSTATMLSSVTSFDRLFAGAPRPALRFEPFPSTAFTAYINMDVVLLNCTRAAAHRVFLLDTPSSEERNAIYRGLLDVENGSLTGGAHGAIIFSSTPPTSSTELQSVDLPDSVLEADDFATLNSRSKIIFRKSSDDMIVQYLEDCEHHNTHVLLVHKGNAPPSEKILLKIATFSPKWQQQRFSKPSPQEPPREHRAVATIRYVVVDDFTSAEGFLDVARSFIEMVQHIHDSIESSEVETARIQKEEDEARARELARIPPVSLPLAEAVINCEWYEGHVPECTRDLKVILAGAPNSGKTTFVTSLVDNFVLRQYIPSSDIEIANIALQVNQLSLDGTYNITFLDGIEHCALPEVWRKKETQKSNARPLPKDAHNASALLTFLDVADPYGVEKWKEAIRDLPVDRPPHIGLLAVKNDIASSSLFSTDALMDLAGEFGAFFTYLDPRSSSANRLIVARFVAHISLLEEKTKINLERQRLVHKKNPNLVPHTEEDITLLFHRYDTAGTGFIDLDEARVILSESRLGLFGETFEDCLEYLVTTYGPLTRARNEAMTPLISKDQLGLMLCRLNKR
jgi:hypothetical protein